MSASEATLPVLDPRTIRELRAVGARLAEDVLSDAVGAFEKTAPGAGAHARARVAGG